MSNHLKLEAMKMKNNLKIGDVLFSVDPLNLKVVKCSVTEIDNNSDNLKIITLEQLGLRKNKQLYIHFSNNDFPFESGNRLFFNIEDDANKFVKTQIGM